jgi:hypothetical protein
MDLVSFFEMGDASGKASHSFWPLPYPEAVSQVPRAESERRTQRIYPDKDKIEGLDPARRYLPCHYFDYIGGTSAGGYASTAYSLPVVNVVAHRLAVSSQ